VPELNYFVGIGIDTFGKGFEPLSGCANDAQALGETFRSLGWVSYHFPERKPTKKRIIEHLRDIDPPRCGLTRVNLVLLIATHGCVHEGETYLAVHGSKRVDLKNMICRTELVDALNAAVRNIRRSSPDAHCQVACVIDACRSPSRRSGGEQAETGAEELNAFRDLGSALCADSRAEWDCFFWYSCGGPEDRRRQAEEHPVDGNMRGVFSKALECELRRSEHQSMFDLLLPVAEAVERRTEGRQVPSVDGDPRVVKRIPLRPQNSSWVKWHDESRQTGGEPPGSASGQGEWPSLFAPDDRIGLYRLIRELGRGRFGQVWLARHIDTGHRVALKIATDRAYIAQLRSESRALAAMDRGDPLPRHESIVQMHGFDLNTQPPHMCMEYVDGQNLRQGLMAAPVPVPRLVDILSQILGGLAHAHSCNVLHGDIKPENIMLDRNGRIRILDFGVGLISGSLTAGLVHEDRSRTGAARRRPSADWGTQRRAFGTGRYLSPERENSREPAEDDDLYAVGVLAADMFAGQAVALANLQRALLRKGAPPPLASFIVRACSERAERFATATEMAAALACLARQLAIAGQPAEPAPKTARPKAGKAAPVPPRPATGAVPWPGEDWTVPELGMPFVWVVQLGYWAGRHTVTNSEFAPCLAQGCAAPHAGSALDDPRQPVVHISFEEMCAYSVWLTSRERTAGRLPKNLSYRLPTRTEWSVLAQCGDDREYPWGDAWPPTYGNYAGTQTQRLYPDVEVIRGYTDSAATSCPVEESGANEWGLYGLGGNVWEATLKDRMPLRFDAWRGGAWDSFSPPRLQCLYRDTARPRGKSEIHGFRLVLGPPLPATTP
jgi:formylglycine-generating enzyme required for sulfatase activity